MVSLLGGEALPSHTGDSVKEQGLWSVLTGVHGHRHHWLLHLVISDLCSPGISTLVSGRFPE